MFKVLAVIAVLGPHAHMEAMRSRQPTADEAACKAEAAKLDGQLNKAAELTGAKVIIDVQCLPAEQVDKIWNELHESQSKKDDSI